ncbi:MAG: DUF4747 family protein [Aurantimonas endophytica]|uniref:DUF4747 family protein n=1 Tax=Aurantimonas endophytica TaxID=1522175 RepID=UPI0030025BDA
MADEARLEYCVLNIAASPHPEGIYIDLLKQAATNQVKYWGDRYATISAPQERENGYWQGRILTWDNIDFSEPGIDTGALKEVDVSGFGDTLPPNIGFNGRVFLYTLRVSDHRLFVETMNDLGKTLSPRQAGKIFDALLNLPVQPPDSPVVSVTVIPDEDALKQILSIDQLKKLRIHLVRPNADDIGDEADEVLQELVEQGAKSQDILLTAVAGEGLKPNEHTLAQASVAEINGYVDGNGREADGTRVSYSTREYPKIIRRTANEFASIFDGALAVAKATVIRDRSG